MTTPPDLTQQFINLAQEVHVLALEVRAGNAEVRANQAELRASIAELRRETGRRFDTLTDAIADLRSEYQGHTHDS